MIHQLRIYEIFDQNKEAFHNRFRDHAWRIMRSYGFNILGMWETRLGDRTEFVYLLVWPDEKTMRHAWEQFKANEEWKEIKKITNARHGDLVGEIQDRMLTPTGYSPAILAAPSSGQKTQTACWTSVLRQVRHILSKIIIHTEFNHIYL